MSFYYPLPLIAMRQLARQPVTNHLFGSMHAMISLFMFTWMPEQRRKQRSDKSDRRQQQQPPGQGSQAVFSISPWNNHSIKSIVGTKQRWIDTGKKGPPAHRQSNSSSCCRKKGKPFPLQKRGEKKQKFHLLSSESLAIDKKWGKREDDSCTMGEISLFSLASFFISPFLSKCAPVAQNCLGFSQLSWPLLLGCTVRRCCSSLNIWPLARSGHLYFQLLRARSLK